MAGAQSRYLTPVSSNFCNLVHVRTNSVDVLYAAFPAYLYLSPALAGYTLKPLLESQDTPLYTVPYAAQDMGTFFVVSDEEASR